MEFKQFVEKVEKGITDFMGQDVQVSVKQIRKNNGVILQGLIILKKNSNITPTIYLNGFYEEYENGMTLSNIIREIVQLYESKSIVSQVDMEFFLDYEKVKERIVYKLIDYERNKEFLKEVPYIPFLDLAIVFYYTMINDVVGNGSIQIYNNHLETWNVTVEELYRQADSNTPKLQKYEVKSMEQIIRELFGGEETEEYMQARSNPPMYVLSNKKRFQGAVSMLYKDLLKSFSGQLDKNLYILPSSIHEVILIPDLLYAEPCQFMEMVKEVNDTQVEPEEVLSDSVYYYDRIEDTVAVFINN